ncbi:ead/Ea22-like family protein [Enterobacter hormaechei]|uniref:ead/Ea22-like family protein n=1 Tax=Enterobacter hormaechei TaxID=158836 RepID=UPI001F46C890|nr:ead/Ea22-like family protein [Enterobacter hormaechei]MCF2333899.1 ead/Ea22-like family protein [Enterobacter hormaechei]MCF2336906.1 ead/Ea22-like family protein [Enterobacter hormaechei]MCF2392723.1 ead/Ea22-like family protein [Enterobacter hormaechei]MCF2394501.1 ead/Ea22-like family protein [Enterobacter hormaechei]MCM7125394.1 ead/Ea22-like family protein [Enterobacter hormaechei]
MRNIDKQALRLTAEKAKDNFMPNFMVPTRDVLALLDELEAAEKKTVEMPTFDGYVPHVARELQAAFRIACDNAGINVAAAGKGEAS